ncbi:MAG: hypothetical protein SPI83_03890 [Rothia sp. (in: high G+C Gram-positive bacteria)]|nr:hypothetical protein [Rothia sp. (in: high G+C Gram-positive bacteria)]
MTDTYVKALISIFAPLPSADDAERGDVPGWVMITMMSAILVAAILVIAQDALVNMFNNAMSMISR